MEESRMLARLNANENPYAPSPKVIQAIAESVSQGNRYGHSDAETLISMIAEKEGVSKECIMLGPGSTDLLEKLAITRFQHGGNIVSADPPLHVGHEHCSSDGWKMEASSIDF